MKLEYGEYESILGDTFGVWSCPFWSTVLRILSAADTHLKLLDRVVSGARFLTGSVVKCDVAHHRSVAVLSMLYKIRCNPMHPLYNTLPLQYVSARFARGACFVHRYIVYLCASLQQNIGIQYTYSPPRCRTSVYSILMRLLAAEPHSIAGLNFIPFSVSLWNNLADLVLDGVGQAGFKRPMLFYCPKLLDPC